MIGSRPLCMLLFALSTVSTPAALAAGEASAPVKGKLQIVGEGKQQEMVVEQFPVEQRPRYALFKARCTKCHAMARPIAAITTGVTPVTGSPFDVSYVKKYVVKMMRKPNSGITKEDAREIIPFLQYAVALERGLPLEPGSPTENPSDGATP